MQPRVTIACDSRVAFIVSHGNASPSALKLPLWLRLPANDNRAAEKAPLRVVDGLAPTSSAF
jgi:hypothetical protein